MKMYCIFARESIEKMGGNRGKLAAQAGHAFMGAYSDACARGHWDAGAPGEDHWAKIVLAVDTVEDLGRIAAAYKHRKFWGMKLITDAGRTVFDGPTRTCLGIGPLAEDDTGEDIRNLQVLL